MRAPAFPVAYKIAAALMGCLLACGLLPVAPAEAATGPGTTIGIAVYRSAYESKWHLNDGGDDAVKASYGEAELPEEVTPGVVAELPEGSDPIRAGYDFLGWNTAADGSGARIGIDVTPQPKEGEELELYAIWRAIPYTVIFDLSKNPDETTLSSAIAWDGHSLVESSKNIWVAKGITADMGPKGQVAIPGGTDVTRTDYRFLGWAEGEGVPAYRADDGTWMIDMTQMPSSGTTLRARWAFKVGVIAPNEITFGDFDLLQQEGPALDGSVSQDRLDGEDGATGAGEQASFFHSSTLSADLSIAGLESTQLEGAAEVLFSPDTSQWPDVFAQNLLSLFPLSAGPGFAESDGVHFKLGDAKGEDELAGLFLIPKDGSLAVSYRLNLDTRWDDGTRNHAIVGNARTADRTKVGIAKVRYEFAVAESGTTPSCGHDHMTATGTTADALYLQHGGSVYGLADLKEAADCLSALGPSSPCYGFYLERLNEGATFKLKVGGSYYDVNILGICQDTKTTGAKAGLTFGFSRPWPTNVHMNSSYSGIGTQGWAAMGQRSWLQEDASLNGFPTPTFWAQLDDRLKDPAAGIVAVRKVQQLSGGTTAAFLQHSEETVFIASVYEVFGLAASGINGAEGADPDRFQYQFYARNGQAGVSPNANAAIPKSYIYLRSACQSNNGTFTRINKDGTYDKASPQPGPLMPCFAL